MGLLLFYLFLALGVSFLCSLVEAGILSLSQATVVSLVKENRRGGRWLEAMKQNIDRPLAAILTLNTISHTVGAAGVGGQTHALYGHQWVAVASALLTLLILVLSEIIPKTVGAVYARRLAGFTAYTVQGMIILTYPLVVIFQALSRLLSGGQDHHRLTREEFAVLAELGEAHGALADHEFRIIGNLLRLDGVLVKEVMTPRNVVVTLQRDLTVQQAVEREEVIRFSRVPICGDSPDDFSGVVRRQQLYESLSAGQGQRPLHEIAAPAHAVPETATVRQALDEFVRQRQHLFVVVDEFGGMAGIITLEDTIETLLGVEIVDETDAVADMRQLAVRMFQGAVSRK